MHVGKKGLQGLGRPIVTGTSWPARRCRKCRSSGQAAWSACRVPPARRQLPEVECKSLPEVRAVPQKTRFSGAAVKNNCIFYGSQDLVFIYDNIWHLLIIAKLVLAIALKAQHLFISRGISWTFMRKHLWDPGERKTSKQWESNPGTLEERKTVL